MDLDSMKNKWKMIDDATQENIIVDQQVLEHNSKRKYTHNIFKFAIPELLLSVLYLYLLFFFLGFNHFFDTLPQKMLSYLAIALLIILPYLSLANVYQFYRTGQNFSTYSDTLKLLERQCRKFNKLQNVIVGLNLVLLFCCIFLMPRVYQEQLSSKQTTVIFIIGGILSLFLSHYFWKYYRKKIKHNEELLESLMRS